MCQLSLVLRRKFDSEQCCLSCYLLIELISDTLDMASYNREEVILSVTIFFKRNGGKKSVFDPKKNL